MISNVKKKISDLPFRRKLLISHAMVCIVPIVILGVFCYYQVVNLLMEREQEDLSQSILQAKQTVDGDLQVYENIAVYLSMHSQIKGYLQADYKNTSLDYYRQHEFYMELLKPTMLNLGIQHDGLESIVIYTKNPMAYRSGVIMSFTEVENEEWAREAIGGREISWYREGEEKIRCSFAFSEMEEGKEALVSLNINYKKLFAPFYQLVGTDYGIIIARQNDILMERNTFEREGTKGLGVSALREASDNPYDALNAQYLILNQRLDSVGWDVYLYKPYSIIHKSVAGISNGVAIIIVICILLLGLIIPVLSGSVANRLERLTQQIQNINLDNLEEKIDGEGEDEIGILIRNMNRMLTRIQHLIEEVYETKLKKKNFELKALQAQITPHFLYNTMSLINCQAILAGQKDISELSQAIASFYRTILNKGKDAIQVQYELENIKAYLYIQSVMNNNSFDIIYHIEDEVYSGWIINLILQPVVENAIEHGLDQKEDGTRGRLYIEARKEQDEILFVVEDNGIGIPEEKVDTLLTTGSEGYGIKNVNDRIQLMYGVRYGLRIFSKDGEGTRIEIRLPYENEPKHIAE